MENYALELQEEVMEGFVAFYKGEFRGLRIAVCNFIVVGKVVSL
jgi:hypothetical protein